MALISVNIPIVTPNELIDKGKLSEVQTALDKFKSISPENAFKASDMLALKTTMEAKVKSLQAAGDTSFSALGDSLGKLTNKDMSKIMFDSGVDPDDFSLDSVDLSASGLKNLQGSVKGFMADAAGGCDAMKILKNSVSVSELSLKDLNIGDTLKSFTGPIAADFKSIGEEAKKSVTDLVGDIEKNVKDAVGDIRKQLDSLGSGASLNANSITSGVNAATGALGGATGALGGTIGGVTSNLPNIVGISQTISGAINASGSITNFGNPVSGVTLNSIKDTLKAEAEVLKKTFEDSAKSLVSGVKGYLSELQSTSGECFDHEIEVNISKINNLQKNVDKLPDVLKDVSAVALKNTQNQLASKLDTVKSYMSEENKQKVSVATAALIKKLQENNPESDPKEIANKVKQDLLKANQQNEEKLKKMINHAKDFVNQTKHVYNDISRASRAAEVSSSQAGRPVADKPAVVAEASKWMDKNKVFDAAFYGNSKFASHNANLINSLHPIVRERVANAVKDFVIEHKPLGYDIKILSAHRSIQEQKNLQKSQNAVTRQVAAKGYSWHNFKVAIDINLYDIKQGKFISRSELGYYTGIARSHFSKYKMYNPLDGTYGRSKILDPNHFIPQELVGKSIRQNSKILITARGTPDIDGISTLLT